MNGGEWKEWRQFVLAELKRLSKDTAQTHKRLETYNEILIRNTTSLEEHVKRSNLLEMRIEQVDEQVKRTANLVSFFNWLTNKDNLITKAILALGTLAAAYIVKRYL